MEVYPHTLRENVQYSHFFMRRFISQFQVTYQSVSKGSINEIG